jgi:hypothetical protein
LKTIHTSAVILGLAAFLGLAPVGAQAGDIVPPVGGAVSAERPERPERPEKPKNSATTERPNLTEIRDVVNNFQAEKSELIKQQKEAAKTAADEARRQLKDAKITGDVGGVVRKELKEAVVEAAKQAKEQARKLKEEEAAAAKENRGKN